MKSANSIQKPFHKTVRFGLTLVASAALLGACSAETTEEPINETNQTTEESKADEATADVAVEDEVAEPVVEEEKEEVIEEPAEPEVPTEFKSALTQAGSYSETMHMSKAGIYDQLTSEYGGQFPAEAAQYAIDNVDADWNANALESAKSYQETMAMSGEAIRDQLTSEYGGQFTAEEAAYAIDNLN